MSQGDQTEISAAIAADKKDHPDYSYSTSTSKSCRLVNGKLQCETVESVLRQCQGESPCEIFNSHVKTDGGDAHHQMSNNQEFLDTQRAMQDMMDHAFGGMLGGGFGDRRGLPEFRRPFFSFPPGRAEDGGGDIPDRANIPVAPHHFPKGKYPFFEKKKSAAPPAGADVADV